MLLSVFLWKLRYPPLERSYGVVRRSNNWCTFVSAARASGPSFVLRQFQIAADEIAPKLAGSVQHHKAASRGINDEVARMRNCTN